MSTASNGWRFYFIIGFILLIVVGLAFRLIDLSILNRHFLRMEGNARTLRLMHTPAFRGIIMDRQGYPLAVSTVVYSIWINPQEFHASEKAMHHLSQLLNLKQKKIDTILERHKTHEFAYVKREVPPVIAKKVKSLGLTGLYLQEDYKRFYPESEVMAHVVGFTNVDDKGQEGLELAYNDWLKGEEGKKIVRKDRLGRVVADVKDIQEQKPGNNLVLSVSRQIQYLAYRELLQGVQDNFAASGTVVVLDIKTGEILAMVNQPSFNPNNRSHLSPDLLRNRAVTDLFEPGSTVKAFSVITALNSGKYTPETVIDTYPGWISIGRHVLKDEHRKGPMTIAQILQYSSNVGIAKMISTIPPTKLWELLHNLGFGEESGVGFPGERAGSLVKREVWPPLALATLAIGYGVSVTPLQLAHAYATLANDGMKIPLSLLRVDKSPQGQRVIDSVTAKKMLVLLEAVVGKGGTAQVASIPGFHVAGKTGTSKLVGQHGYEKHRYNSVFVGLAPATQPRLVVAVIIHDPQGKKYYGGDVSGPIFKKIMEGSLRILNVPPDDIKPPQSTV